MAKQRAARMRRLVAQWRQSGESQAGFARRHGIPTWTFWYWCRKASPPAVVQPAAAAFVPIRVTPETEVGVVDVVFPAGERVRVGAGASADLVRLVVAAVRATC
jgi:hypothetical protein